MTNPTLDDVLTIIHTYNARALMPSPIAVAAELDCSIDAARARLRELEARGEVKRWSPDSEQKSA